MSQQLSVINPNYEGSRKPEDAPSQGFFAKYGKIIGVIAIATAFGSAGYVAGKMTSSAAGTSTPAASQGSQVSAEVQARNVLAVAFQDPTMQAMADDLKYSDIETMIGEYRASKPVAFDDSLMNAFGTIYDSFVADISKPRSLRSSEPVNRMENYNRMLGNLDLTSPNGLLISKAWKFVREASYSNAIVSGDGNDRAAVWSENSDCFVLAEESQTGADWQNNLKTGSVSILGLWNDQALGSGFKGFTNAYNSMRKGIAAGIDRECKGKRIVMIGYSRGGSIVNNVALALRKDGRYNKQKQILITFGCPRSLQDVASDFLFSETTPSKNFEHVRLIYKKDPVPSLPYGWMGVKHAIAPLCKECGYTESRDAPGWSWPQDSGFHTQYDLWFTN